MISRSINFHHTSVNYNDIDKSVFELIRIDLNIEFRTVRNLLTNWVCSKIISEFDNETWDYFERCEVFVLTCYLCIFRNFQFFGGFSEFQELRTSFWPCTSLDSPQILYLYVTLESALWQMLKIFDNFSIG